MLDLGSSPAALSVGYIVSLPHSGSTILGYNLSEHPDVVFLGEVGYAIADLKASKEKNPLCFAVAGRLFTTASFGAVSIDDFQSAAI